MLACGYCAYLPQCGYCVYLSHMRLLRLLTTMRLLCLPTPIRFLLVSPSSAQRLRIFNIPNTLCVKRRVTCGSPYTGRVGSSWVGSGHGLTHKHHRFRIIICFILQSYYFYYKTVCGRVILCRMLNVNVNDLVNVVEAWGNGCMIVNMWAVSYT